MLAPGPRTARPPLGRHASRLKALRNLRSWDLGTLRAYQESCLRSVVRHAARRVPYFRRLLAEAGLAPDAIRTLPDLALVPISDRHAMQALASTELLAQGFAAEQLLAYLSSGSTGEPFVTRRTRGEDRLLLAFRMRILQQLGVRLTDRWASLKWLGREAGEIAVERRFVPRRGRSISCLASVGEQLAELRRTRFEILGGLPVTIGEITQAMTKADRATMRPRMVITGGETSTAELRRHLSETFSAPAYDLYGTNEFMATAWQCPSTGLYHVADPTVVLEVVDERGRPVPTGEEGEIVGTSLHAYAMPFIRYRLDDLAVRGETPCPCGAPWSTLVRILGRVTERFRRLDGTALHPYALSDALMSGAPWLQGFQIVQERLDLVRLRLRPLRSQQPPPDGLARAAAEVRGVLGGTVEVTAELVDELPRGGRGKALHYVCLVK